MTAVHNKKSAIDAISRTLSIIQVDMKLHQSINDQSVNIFSENFFRDVFNYIAQGASTFKDANFEDNNAAFIDLIDEKLKILVQVTSTRTYEKARHSLNIFQQSKYKKYSLVIYYLDTKPRFNSNTISKLRSEFGSVLLGKTVFKDSTNLIKEINNLSSKKVIELQERFFDKQEQRYTDVIKLNMACKILIKEMDSISPNYNESFGSLDSNKKIEVNCINSRVASQINMGLDYAYVIDNLENEEVVYLRELIVSNYYRRILFAELRANNLNKDLVHKDVDELQNIAIAQKADFSKLLDELRTRIEGQLIEINFTSRGIVWGIVSYFFEICDIGGRRIDTTI